MISFVTVPLKVTLTPCGPLSYDESSDKIEWKNTASSFPYSLTSSTSKEEGLMLINEESTVYTNPRVYSWEVKLVVDGSSPVEAQRYTGEFKLKVKTTT